MSEKNLNRSLPSSAIIHSLSAEMLARTVAETQEWTNRSGKKSEYVQVQTFELLITLLDIIIDFQLFNKYGDKTRRQLMDLLMSDFLHQLKTKLGFRSLDVEMFFERLNDNLIEYGRYGKDIFPKSDSISAGTLTGEIGSALVKLWEKPRLHVDVPIFAATAAVGFDEILNTHNV